MFIYVRVEITMMWENVHDISFSVFGIFTSKAFKLFFKECLCTYNVLLLGLPISYTNAFVQ